MQQEKVSLKTQLRNTFKGPILVSSIGLCLLNMVRYGVITWIPTFLYRIHSFPIEKVGFSIFLIPIAGVLGTLMYNKIKLPKDILTIMYMLLLGLSFVIFPFTSGWLMVIILLLSGFFLYGPHVFLVSTMPSRYKKEKVVAASTGFIDGMGYVGAVAVGILVPFLIGHTGGWGVVFQFWTVLSVIIATLVGVTYIKKFRKDVKKN